MGRDETGETGGPRVSDTIDPPRRRATAPPAQGSVYSSMDAPPPPFQIGAPQTRNSDPGRPPQSLRSDPGGAPRSNRGRSPRVAPRSRRIAPAEVQVVEEPEDDPVTEAPAPPAYSLRPERLPEGQINPGVVVAVAVSLLASMTVYLFTVGVG